MRYVLVLCLLGLCGCACVKGTINLTRNDKGEIMTVKYDAKNMMDFKVKKDEVEVMTRKKPKPTPLDKVLDTLSMGAANRIMNSEKDED